MQIIKISNSEVHLNINEFISINKLKDDSDKSKMRNNKTKHYNRSNILNTEDSISS